VRTTIRQRRAGYLTTPKAQSIVLLLILAAAAALRLYALGAESLWFDEAYSVWVARHGIGWQLSQSTQRIFPPAYYSLLHVWLALGDSEFAVRLLSVLLGLLSVLGMYALARQLFDVRVGLIAAAILAVSPLHVAYSQEARMYILLAALGTWSAYLMLLALQHGRRWQWLSYVITMAIAMNTHYFAIFLALFQNLYVLHLVLRRRSRRGVWKPWLLSQAMIGMLSVVGLWGIFSGETTYWWGLLDTWHGAPTLRDLATTVFHFSLGNTVEGKLFYYGGLLLFGFCAAWSIVDVKNRRLSIDAGLLFAGLYLAVPLGTVFLLSQFQSFWVLRYVFPFLPPWCIIVARGISRIPGHGARILTSAAIVLASLLPLANLYGYEQKEDWRGAVGYISALEGPGDAIILVDEDVWIPFEHYYRGSTRIVGISRGVADPALLAARVGMLLPSSSRIWLVLSHTDNLALKEYLQASRYTRLLAEKHFTQVEVDLFAVSES